MSIFYVHAQMTLLHPTNMYKKKPVKTGPGKSRMSIFGTNDNCIFVLWELCISTASEKIEEEGGVEPRNCVS